MKKLTKYFLKGLAFLVPVVLTVYVIYAVFTKVDNLFKFQIPGMGVLATFLIITFIGFMASNFLTRWVVNLVDRLMRRLPLVKMIYTSVKDLIHAFVGEKKGFDRPVAVSLGGGVKAVGFITSDSLEKLGMADMVSVYLPQSYNFAGNLIMVPKEQVTPVDGDSGDIMAFIVSGGIASK
jgi:uncharacterized membrane protein